jgi:hypothetical protein
MAISSSPRSKRKKYILDLVKDYLGILKEKGPLYKIGIEDATVRQDAAKRRA